MKLDARISIRGEVRSDDDLVVEGRVDGPIWAEGMVVTLAPTAHVTGDIVGREITIHGAVVGSLLASEIVDVRVSGRVEGRVISPRFALRDGGLFNGKVQPQHLHAALTVARHRNIS